MLEVTSYKIDPRGEEYFAELKEHSDFDFSKTFVNRLVYYRGEGKFIPLINTRVLYDLDSKSTIYSGSHMMHPSSRDYKNPFIRASDTDETVRRISVSMIETVKGPSYARYDFNADEDDLKALFKSEPVKLARKIKAPTKEDQKTNRESKDSKVEREQSDQRKERKKKVVDEKFNEGADILPKKENVNERKSYAKADKRELVLKTCKILCIQGSAMYSHSDFDIERDVDKAIKQLDESLESMSIDYISELNINTVAGIPAIIMLKDKTVIGYSPLVPRVKGILLTEDLGLVMLEGSGV